MSFADKEGVEEETYTSKLQTSLQALFPQEWAGRAWWQWGGGALRDAGSDSAASFSY